MIKHHEIVLKKRLEKCQLMKLSSSEFSLYLSCAHLYKYNLIGYPESTVPMEEIPDINIKIKEIFEYDDLVAFVGRNEFQMMYLDVMINDFEGSKIDKIIFGENLYIGANEKGIVIGDYKIIDQYITCQVEDFVGKEELLFRTRAECDQQYFEMAGMSVEKILGADGVTVEDQCMYTVYKDINVWKEDSFSIFKAFVLPSILVVVAGLIALGVWIFEKARVGQM